jgi:hypothetical protein
MSTRFYLIPFHPDPPSAGFPDGTCPKYLDLFPRGSAQGILPEEVSPKLWRVPFYLMAITADNDADFAPLEANADVLKLYPNADLATIKTGLQTAGVNVSSLRGKYNISDVKGALYAWMGISDGKDHLAIRGLV